MNEVRQRWPLVLAGLVAVATSAGYATLISKQETSSLSDPVPLLVAAGFAAWGLARSRRASWDSAWLVVGVGLVAAALALVLLVLP